jgi:hypothetical protein
MASAWRYYYDEGLRAAQDGHPPEAIPYPPDSAEGGAWKDGFEAYDGGREVAEHERLDDPRHGQAKDINNGRF